MSKQMLHSEGGELNVHAGDETYTVIPVVEGLEVAVDQDDIEVKVIDAEEPIVEITLTNATITKKVPAPDSVLELLKERKEISDS